MSFEITKENAKGIERVVPLSEHHNSLGLNLASSHGIVLHVVADQRRLLRIVLKKCDTMVIQGLVVDEDVSAKIGLGSNQTRACNPRPTSQGFGGSENAESSTS
jgi:hypothetical protein